MTRPHSAQTRLASYGTLAPGRIKHHELEGLGGDWRQGTVRGRLYDEGWGATLGFPAIVLDEAAPEVELFILESNDLPAHWPRLDAFEGEGYARTIATAQTESGPIEVSIYVLDPAPNAP